MLSGRGLWDELILVLPCNCVGRQARIIKGRTLKNDDTEDLDVAISLLRTFWCNMLIFSEAIRCRLICYVIYVSLS